MASLKNIMNTEDDQVDSTSHKSSLGSGPKSSIHPESSASRSTYISKSSQSSTPSVHNSTNSIANSNSNSRNSNRARSIDHPSSSSAAEPSFSPSFSGITSDRRRSSSNSNSKNHNSNDTMDHSYGHGHAGSSSNIPPRSFTPGASSAAELPRKLTPITKRVSRAKKGIPVHTCDICRPPKTFTRAEHLRRHQLSHQPPELACPWPGCSKVFHRKDLLERHQQRHEQDEKASRTGSPRKRSTAHHENAPHETPSTIYNCNSGPGSTTSSGPPTFPQNTMPPVWTSLSTYVGPNQISSPSMPNSSGDYNTMTDDAGNYCIDLQGPPEGFNSYTPRTTVPVIYIPDGEHGGITWTDSSTMPSSSSESNFSTPSDSHPTIFPEWTSQLAQSPVMEVCGIHYPYSTSPSQIYPPVYSDSLVSMPGYGDDNSLYGSSTTVRSLPPQLALAQSSETLVTVPSTPLSERIINPSACGRQPGEAFGLLATRDVLPVSLDCATRDAIPAYLDVYWEKVHPLHPIIHQSTYDSEVAGGHLDVLQCAMAAVAAQFLDGKEHRSRGSQLYDYARNMSKMFTQAPEEWPIPVMQTLALCEYYGQFRGRKAESYKTSPRFESLYKRVFHSQNPFTPHRTGRDVDRQWRTWVAMESRRRLLAACFLLDVHGSRYYEKPLTVVPGLDYSSPSTLPIPLTANTTRAWDAQSWREWCGIQPWKELKAVNNTSLESLTPLDIISAPAFDATVLLAASSLELPRRRSPNQIDLIKSVTDIEIDLLPVARVFYTSGSANTYLALHHTPLRCLLSVSGESWVFNKKLTQVSLFMEHQNRLREWRHSGSAAAAVIFAARALKAFLNLGVEATGAALGDSVEADIPSPSWTDISDYWGIYVCALICWAFGHTGERNGEGAGPAPIAAVQWILMVAGMQPEEVQSFSRRYESYGVINLVRQVLSRDCFGGSSILFADAVGVLKKLSEGDGRELF